MKKVSLLLMLLATSVMADMSWLDKHSRDQNIRKVCLDGATYYYTPTTEPH